MFYCSYTYGDIKVTAEYGKKEIRGSKHVQLLLSKFLLEYNTSLSNYYLINDLSEKIAGLFRIINYYIKYLKLSNIL